ncbi:MAG: hypothetical protein OXC80_08550 [Gammaproteobacteria bacterium]|nr:hypothetical protein [Gammaproteobacteria bacterium]
MGGKESNQHASKTLNSGHGAVGKLRLLGLGSVEERYERNKSQLQLLTPYPIEQRLNNLKTGSTAYSHDHRSYQGTGQCFNHVMVTHSISKYVEHESHTVNLGTRG